MQNKEVIFTLKPFRGRKMDSVMTIGISWVENNGLRLQKQRRRSEMKSEGSKIKLDIPFLSALNNWGLEELHVYPSVAQSIA